MLKEKGLVEQVFRKAGVTVNGKNPWDIQVHDDRLYRRLVAERSLGLGESYMEKWWDCERIDLLVERMIRSGVHAGDLSWPVIWLGIKSWLLNLQSRYRAKQVLDQHYDLSNELYGSFLDPYWQYSCGYFKNTNDLDKAQEQKLDLICRKLQLKSTDRVLDMGCGWGGFTKYAAEHYGCSVVAVNISEVQTAYARDFTKGLPVEIRTQDYRDLSGEKFDKIAIIGMIEHVGYKNYRRVMEIAHECLAEDGLFLLHTIGQNRTSRAGNAWSDKYIFRNGMLPSQKQLATASEGLFVLEDVHSFGQYYAETLRAWDENFQKHWPSIEAQFSPTFYRMFRYYFNSFAGAFRARHIQLWQTVYSKGNSASVYESVR